MVCVAWVVRPPRPLGPPSPRACVDAWLSHAAPGSLDLHRRCSSEWALAHTSDADADSDSAGASRSGGLAHAFSRGRARSLGLPLWPPLSGPHLEGNMEGGHYEGHPSDGGLGSRGGHEWKTHIWQTQPCQGRDIGLLERGGGRGGGVQPDPPSSYSPPMTPAEGGPQILKLKSSWHRRRRSKIFAVSLKHYKRRREGGKGSKGRGVGGGQGRYPPPRTVYGRSNTSLPGPQPATIRSCRMLFCVLTHAMLWLSQATGWPCHICRIISQ